MQTISLNVGQSVSVVANPSASANPTDNTNPGALAPGAGTPASGVNPTWSSDTPSVATAISDDTGLAATIAGVAIGTANVTVSGPNNASGTATQTFEVIVSGVVLAAALGFWFTFGTPS